MLQRPKSQTKMDAEWWDKNPPSELEQKLTNKSANCLVKLVKFVAAAIAVLIMAFFAVILAFALIGVPLF